MRVPRTFVFVDLSNFTDFTSTNGDEAAARILASFRAATREVTSNHGVRVAKWLGDGAMIVSVDEEAAIASALELEERAADACAPLALRAGIASGHALLFEGDDYIGSAVNLAARLCDLAGPYEVLAPAHPPCSLPQGVEAVPAGTRDVKGFAEPVRVTRLVGHGQVLRDDAEELWTRPPFVA